MGKSLSLPLHMPLRFVTELMMIKIESVCSTHRLILAPGLVLNAPLSSNKPKKAMTTEFTEHPPSTSGGLSREKLDEDGFVVLRESAFGQRFEDFVRKGLPFKSADGLNFCRATALEDIVSKLYTVDLRFLI